MHHKFIEDGIRKQEIVNYEPILGYQVEKECEWKDIYGHNIETKRFSDMSSANEWKKENNTIIDIFGDISFPIAFISEKYPNEIELQKKAMNIYAFDIEAFSLDIENAPEPIRAITFQNLISNTFHVFAYKETFVPFSNNIKYHQCNDENHLLKMIIDFFNRQDIDILTGWNIDNYDIGYLYNRIRVLLGEELANTISPIKKVSKSDKTINKRLTTVYRIEGIVSWDYMTLYKKFTKDNRESYSLNFISQFELGEEKTNYKEE
jgi:DNA polymerase elongation subunit (family B)